MNRPFLIGRFLPAHGSNFGKLPNNPLTKGGLSADMLEKRFQERAVSYRQRNRQHLIFGQIGMLLALTLTLGAFNARFALSEAEQFVAPDQEVVRMEEMVQTEQIQRPPPPPRPPVPVEVPDDTRLDELDLDLDSFLDLDVAISDMPPPPPAPVAEEEEEDEVFLVVEQMPVIKGGLKKLYDYVSYPKVAQKSGLEGTVVVKLIVSPEGKPTKPEVIKSVHQVLDDAAVAGIMKLEFEPARQRSRAVAVWISIPVVFELK